MIILEDKIRDFKNIFKGLQRAHGCTKGGPSNNNG